MLVVPRAGAGTGHDGRRRRSSSRRLRTAAPRPRVLVGRRGARIRRCPRDPRGLSCDGRRRGRPTWPSHRRGRLVLAARPWTPGRCRRAIPPRARHLVEPVRAGGPAGHGRVAAHGGEPCVLARAGEIVRKPGRSADGPRRPLGDGSDRDDRARCGRAMHLGPVRPVHPPPRRPHRPQEPLEHVPRARSRTGSPVDLDRALRVPRPLEPVRRPPPGRELARPDGSHYAPEAAVAIARTIVSRALEAAGLASPTVRARRPTSTSRWAVKDSNLRPWD